MSLVPLSQPNCFIKVVGNLLFKMLCVAEFTSRKQILTFAVFADNCGTYLRHHKWQLLFTPVNPTQNVFPVFQKKKEM